MDKLKSASRNNLGGHKTRSQMFSKRYMSELHSTKKESLQTDEDFKNLNGTNKGGE